MKHPELGKDYSWNELTAMEGYEIEEYGEGNIYKQMLIMEDKYDKIFYTFILIGENPFTYRCMIVSGRAGTLILNE